jgi:ATP synthase in type III secretion protein N
MTARGAGTDPLVAALRTLDTVKRVGRVAEARGTLIRATGVNARIGEVCELRDPASQQILTAEVVAVERGATLLMPLGMLQGFSADAEVVGKGLHATVGAGPGLIGRALDALGNVIDGLPAPVGLTRIPVYRAPPGALTRAPARRPFFSGVRAIDALLTIGEGQHVGVFAPEGCGKSTLLGMLARSNADVNVIVLIGVSGREVRELVDDNLGAEGLKKCVVIVATSDRPALERSRAAYSGMAVAEYFRDQGKRVLLLFDSVTRFARALRDVGLAAGELPVRHGYPSSAFGALPGLFERGGNTDHGSITAFYTVELESAADPINDEVRSILDGHICLSSSLAAAGHFPAIDILASRSRLMSRVARPEHFRAAAQLRKQLAKYEDVQRLLRTGEYRQGSDVESDEALQNMPAILRLLQQPADQLSGFDEIVAGLMALAR